MPPGPTKHEIEEALHSLGSEHGEGDVRNIEWWRANAAYVRPELRAMLDDDKDDGQSDRWALRILGDIGHADDVAVLAKVLDTWKLDTARMAAASALGSHPAAEATAALIAATNHKNIDTVSYATDGLGMRKDDDVARARLKELLNHADETVRYHAVNALVEIGGGRAELEQRKKLEKDPDVKALLVKVLKKK